MQCRSLSAPIVFAALALLSACGGEDRGFARTRPVELDERSRRIGASSAERFGYGPREEQSERQLFTWRTPDDWVERPPSSLRNPNFVVSAHPEVECYVTVLGAGDARDNINRWRKQMGAEPMSPEDFAALPSMPLLGMPAAFVEVEGTYGGMSGMEQKSGWMLRGLYLQAPMAGISVKMIGPADLVTQQRANFEAFVSTLQLDPGEGTAPGNPPPGPSGAATRLAWTAPPHWTTVSESPQSIRLVTLSPEGRESSQCWITVLPGDAGGLERNLNRWARDEMGCPPLTEEEIAALQRIEVLGTASAVLDVDGTFTDSMRGLTEPDAKLLGLVCEMADRTVFVKMVGPSAEIAAEKEHFVSFCQSLRVES